MYIQYICMHVSAECGMINQAILYVSTRLIFYNVSMYACTTKIQYALIRTCMLTFLIILALQVYIPN